MAKRVFILLNFEKKDETTNIMIMLCNGNKLYNLNIKFFCVVILVLNILMKVYTSYMLCNSKKLHNMIIKVLFYVLSYFSTEQLLLRYVSSLLVFFNFIYSFSPFVLLSVYLPAFTILQVNTYLQAVLHNLREMRTEKTIAERELVLPPSQPFVYIQFGHGG